MRRYETIFIVDPDLGEDGRKERLEKNQALIKQMNGVLIEVDDWGNKRLAYEIKKKIRGYYIRLDYCGNGELVDEIERLCRIDDKYLKFMTIVLEAKANPDAILEANETKKAEEAAKKEAEAAEIAKREAAAERAAEETAAKAAKAEKAEVAEKTASDEEDK